MTRTSAPEGWDHVHRILGVAMRAADKAVWPARPHLGGPLPALPLYRQPDVAFAVCASTRPVAMADERRELDRLEALAREALSVGRSQKFTKTDALHRDQLDATSKRSKKDSAVILVGKQTVRCVMHFLYASPSAQNAIGGCIENAAEALVEVLEPAAAGEFLVTLDATIVRVELEALLADRNLTPTSPIARVLSRPKATKGKSLGLAFTELADGRFGLYVKLKGRWHWHEGDRATMFATVPDEYMEHVIEDIEPKAKLRATLRKSRAG